jgi:hypothetical protein
MIIAEINGLKKNDAVLIREMISGLFQKKVPGDGLIIKISFDEVTNMKKEIKPFVYIKATHRRLTDDEHQLFLELEKNPLNLDVFFEKSCF